MSGRLEVFGSNYLDTYNTSGIFMSRGDDMRVYTILYFDLKASRQGYSFLDSGSAAAGLSKISLNFPLFPWKMENLAEHACWLLVETEPELRHCSIVIVSRAFIYKWLKKMWQQICWYGSKLHAGASLLQPPRFYSALVRVASGRVIPPWLNRVYFGSG